MALMNGICPRCNAVNGVDNAKKSAVCEKCKAEFFTEQAIAAWNAAYVVTLHRKKDPSVGNRLTFLTVYRGNLCPLSDGASQQILVSEKEFEIPVLITDNKGREFEGVLAGTGDGKDVEITWAASTEEKLLGRIEKSSNATVRFVERVGAAKNQALHQEL